MKKVLAAVCVVSAMASTTAFALTFNNTNEVGKGVVVSKHNMNNYTETTHDAEGRVCAFCHTPHHSLDNSANTNVDYMPLWSHKLTTQTYVPYYTPTVGVTITNPLTGATALCMSCHDGVVAIDQHYNQNNTSSNVLSDDSFGGTGIGLADNSVNPGAGNLANDHPVGFLYSEALTLHPGDLNPADTVYTGGTKKIQDQLTNGFFTCATCHDVHNKDNVKNTASGSSRNYFLLGDNNGSGLCLTCHKK